MHAHQLVADLHLDGSLVPESVARDAREEMACDELVDELLITRVERVARAREARRVDRRVCGVALRALARPRPAPLVEHAARERAPLGVRALRLDQRREVEARAEARRFRARVRDEAALVELLGHLHRALRRQPQLSHREPLESLSRLRWINLRVYSLLVLQLRGARNYRVKKFTTYNGVHRLRAPLLLLLRVMLHYSSLGILK